MSSRPGAVSRRSAKTEYIETVGTKGDQLYLLSISLQNIFYPKTPACQETENGIMDYGTTDQEPKPNRTLETKSPAARTSKANRTSCSAANPSSWPASVCGATSTANPNGLPPKARKILRRQ